MDGRSFKMETKRKRIKQACGKSIVNSYPHMVRFNHGIFLAVKQYAQECVYFVDNAVTEKYE